MRAKTGSLHLPKKCLDILDEVARIRAACGREPVNLTEVSRDDAETLGGFSAGETRDIAGFDSPNMRLRLRGLKKVNFGILVDLYTLAFPGHELHREWYLARHLYKAAGKLLLDSLEKMKPKFISGCLANAEFREGAYADETPARAAAQEVWNAITRDGR